jgi:hypothetical protein
VTRTHHRTRLRHTQARAKAAKRGSCVRLLVADIADFKPDERFDLVTMLNVPPCVERVVALVRPGGLAINASWYGPGTPFYTPPATRAKGFGRRAPSARASDQSRPFRYPSVLACVGDRARECCLGNAPQQDKPRVFVEVFEPDRAPVRRMRPISPRPSSSATADLHGLLVARRAGDDDRLRGIERTGATAAV